MKINKQMNVVIPCQNEDGETYYVHSQPISREVFDRYALLLSTVFSRIYESGTQLSGAATAKAMLDDIVNEKDKRLSASVDDPELKKETPYADDLRDGFYSEISRLTNVLVMEDDKGWQTYQLNDAISRGILDDKDKSDVENIIVFFIVLWHIHRKGSRAAILNSVLPMWDALLTSLNCSDYRNSLKTSKPKDNIGETAAE